MARFACSASEMEGRDHGFVIERVQTYAEASFSGKLLVKAVWKT
jgi:hypothetical protein